MKKLLLILSVLFAHNSFAQFIGDGFYRVQNISTERYLTVVDTRASVNMNTNEPDLAAILPIRSFEKIVGNPASVIYIDNVSGNNYSLRAQNVDSYDLLGLYLHLKSRGENSYYAYATASGMTKYLCDEASGNDDGWLMTGTANRNWRLLPIDPSKDSYLAAMPEYESDGFYYTTMYAAFPFKAYSEGVKMYYISDVLNNVAIISELDGNFASTLTPVIIQCASANYSDNRLDVLTSGGTKLSKNCLGGVLFNNSNKKHLNRVAYDPNTMRVLGKMADGTIGFITADIDYLPANKAYLKVPAGSAAEIRIMTKGEYETNISNITSDSNANKVYYDLSGRRTAKLTNGIYVSVDGRKICK